MHTSAVDDSPSDDELARFVWTRRAGEIIFTQGEFGAELFIVESGSVELLTTSADGASHSRALLSAGETFGERALLDEQAREITARAVTDCRLLRLDYAMLLELIREKPLIGLYLLRRQVRRVRWLADAQSSETVTPGVGTAQAIATSTLRPRFVHVESGQEFPVPDDAGEAMIGRIDRDTGLAPPIDFTAVDKQRSLSRRHGRVTRDGGLFQLWAEPGAGNGTFLNDRRIPSGQAIALRDGDRVRFGMVDTIFRCT